MRSDDIYEYITLRALQDLKKHGYKINRDGTIIYRYFHDKKIAGAIQLQKSNHKYQDFNSFTFNIACVSYYELPDDYPNDRMTIVPLKDALKSLAAGSERIGHITRGRDYWWEVTIDILNEFTLDEYYDRFVRVDIKKAAVYLEKLAYEKSISDVVLDKAYRDIYGKFYGWKIY